MYQQSNPKIFKLQVFFYEKPNCFEKVILLNCVYNLVFFNLIYSVNIMYMFH